MKQAPSKTSRRRLSWRRLAIATYIAINIAIILEDAPFTHASRDWALWAAIPNGITDGTLYNLGTELPFVWSPVMAPVMAGAALVGGVPWALLHLAVMPLLRDWRLIGLALVSWGFWTDMVGGNTMTFVFVSGALALRGSRRAALVYLGLLLLMPRPVQFPLAAWLLWQRPKLRLPAIAMFLVHASLVFLSGYTADWIQAMIAYATSPAFNMSPTHWFGPWWLAFGIPLGVWLTMRGRVGWAGLAVSNYVLPGYLLLPLMELRGRHQPWDRKALGAADWVNRD